MFRITPDTLDLTTKSLECLLHVRAALSHLSQTLIFVLFADWLIQVFDLDPKASLLSGNFTAGINNYIFGLQQSITKMTRVRRKLDVQFARF